MWSIADLKEKKVERKRGKKPAWRYKASTVYRKGRNKKRSNYFPKNLDNKERGGRERVKSPM